MMSWYRLEHFLHSSHLCRKEVRGGGGNAGDNGGWHACTDDAGDGAGAASGIGVEGNSGGRTGDGGVAGDLGVIGAEGNMDVKASDGGEVFTSAVVVWSCRARSGVEEGESGTAAGIVAGSEGGERTSSSSRPLPQQFYFIASLSHFLSWW